MLAESTKHDVKRPKDNGTLQTSQTYNVILVEKWKKPLTHESMLGRLVNIVNIHDWWHNYMNGWRIENCKESKGQLVADGYDKKEDLRYKKRATIETFNKIIIR